MKLFIGNYNYSSWSLRAWLTLKSCTNDFQVELIRLGHKTSKDVLLSSNPSGKVPCLVDQKLKIWDTLAICEYLNELFPDKFLLPIEKNTRSFVRSCCAEMHSELRALRKECPMEINKPNQQKEISIRSINEFHRLDQMVDEYSSLQLERNLFDYFMTPFAVRARCFPGHINKNTKKYFEVLLNHPHFLEWEKNALLEKWVIEY